MKDIERIEGCIFDANHDIDLQHIRMEEEVSYLAELMSELKDLEDQLEKLKRRRL